MNKRLICACGASARNTSKERGRFQRRHGARCIKTLRQQFTKQLAQGTRSTEPTTWEEHKSEQAVHHE